MKYRILTILAAVLGLIAPTRAMQYAGADISMLPLYEQIGARYNDCDGNPLPDNDVIRWYAAQGMNTMRVRLFVDPSKQLESNYKYDNGNIVVDRQDGLSGKPDQNVCQTKEYILPICQRIKQAGMKLILDSTIQTTGLTLQSNGPRLTGEGSLTTSSTRRYMTTPKRPCSGSKTAAWCPT